MKEWLRHAFAIESASDFAPSAEEARLVQTLCQAVVQRRLALPATVLIESFRPLSNVGAQVLWSVAPWFEGLTDAAGLKTLAAMLERPGAVDYVLDQLHNAELAATVPADSPAGVPPSSDPSPAPQPSKGVPH